ncbi:MAG TPA: hypothetical protein VI381_04155, partial [Allosphingosinicella sp.]
MVKGDAVSSDSMDHERAAVGKRFLGVFRLRGGGARLRREGRQRMREEAAKIEGQCLCGAVTARVRPTRAHIEACHCTMCRKWGGTALLSVQCGSDVEIEGEAHVVRYQSSAWAERGFCGR